jgi:hypothetical protein
MAELYPATLQDNFNRGSFNRTPGVNRIFSENETGPFKVRRRSTLRRDSISGSILLRDLTEYSTFIDFYTSTLQDGTLSFFFNDPALGNQLTVQFREGGMRISDIGFEAFTVQMVLEVVSE